MNDKAMREAFERWMVDTAKCVVGSIDPYAKGIEDRNWTVWQAAVAACEEQWQPIEAAPKGEMFQWGYWKRGKFCTGLAYWNVSGGWSDAYGHPAPGRATHFRILPGPPKVVGA